MIRFNFKRLIIVIISTLIFIAKKEQKAIQLNISNIVATCTEMIKSQKDSEKLIRDLIARLNRVLEDVKTGRLRYEG